MKSKPIKLLAMLFVVSICIVVYAAKEVPWDKADKYYGQTVTVTGEIVTTHNSGKACFLNFHQNWRQYFTAVIFASDFNKFPANPEAYYLNKEVKVTGFVKEYKGKPEIILKDPSQIIVVGGVTKQKQRKSEPVTSKTTKQELQEKDLWDMFLNEKQQHYYGLHKLTKAERANLARLFLQKDSLNESARRYVENELGLDEEFTVARKEGDFLFTNYGTAAKVWAAYDFYVGGTYLADDSSYPDKILTHDGELHDVSMVYSEEDAIEELKDEY